MKPRISEKKGVFLETKKGEVDPCLKAKRFYNPQAKIDEIGGGIFYLDEDEATTILYGFSELINQSQAVLAANRRAQKRTYGWRAAFHGLLTERSRQTKRQQLIQAIGQTTTEMAGMAAMQNTLEATLTASVTAINRNEEEMADERITEIFANITPEDLLE